MLFSISQPFGNPKFPKVSTLPDITQVELIFEFFIWFPGTSFYHKEWRWGSEDMKIGLIKSTKSWICISYLSKTWHVNFVNFEKTGTDKWWRSVQAFLGNLENGTNIYLKTWNVFFWEYYFRLINITFG